MFINIFQTQYNIIRQDYLLNNLSKGYIFEGPQLLGKFDFACEIICDFLKVSNIFQQQNVIVIDKLFQKGENTFDEISKTTNIDQSHRKDKKTDEIIVDDIKLIVEKLTFANKHRHMWVIINNFEKANIYAVDILLKILEDSKYITFIFCTSNIKKIKKTIISRCKVINFNKKDITDLLNITGLNETVLELAVGLPKLAFMIDKDRTLYNTLYKMYNDIETFVKDKNFLTFYKNISGINTDYIFIFIEYIFRILRDNKTFFDFTDKFIKILQYIKDNKIDKKTALDFIIFNIFYAIR